MINGLVLQVSGFNRHAEHSHILDNCYRNAQVKVFFSTIDFFKPAFALMENVLVRAIGRLRFIVSSKSISMASIDLPFFQQNKLGLRYEASVLLISRTFSKKTMEHMPSMQLANSWPWDTKQGLEL